MRTAFCFDLDGTITTTEVLPCIASEIGVSDEIATLTKATMDGHIAFEPSFRLRCAILRNVPIEKVHSIVKNIPLDKSILSFIHSHPSDCFLITGNLGIWIQPIVEKCGCRLFSSIGTFDEGSLKVEKVLNKGDAIAELRAAGYELIVAIGDGANDAPMLAAADLGIAYGGIHSPSSAAIATSNCIIHEGAVLCRMLRAL